MSTLYASFVDASAAERAAGALLDHGARPEDLSIIANERGSAAAADEADAEAASAEGAAKSGISTTTAGDVAIGAVKGTAVGIGVGILAAVTSLLVPGVGVVIGGGAMALAMAGAAATTVAGTTVGGIAGYLSDQGIPEDMVTKYSDTFYAGGAILALAVPSGDLTAEQVEALFTKYGAINIATYNAPRTLADSVPVPERAPMVVESSNPDVAPVVLVDPMRRVETVEHQVIDASTGERSTTVTTTEHLERPVVVVEEQSLTTTPGAEVIKVAAVEPLQPAAVVVDQGRSTLRPNYEAVVAPDNLVHQTVGNPVLVSEEDAVVIDPLTGEAKHAKLVEEQRAVVTKPLMADASGKIVEAPESLHQTTVIREESLVVDEDETHRHG